MSSNKHKPGGKAKESAQASASTPEHVPVHKDKPKPKPKTCTGTETGDVIGSLSAHLGLAAAGIVSPPGAQCATGAADLSLTIGEETGIVCGGSLKTESPVWKGVNIGLASAGAAISCVPVVGNIFNAGRAAVEGVELAGRAIGGWFTSLFRPRVASTAVEAGVELAEHTAPLLKVAEQTAPSAAHAAEVVASEAASAVPTPGRITQAAITTGGRTGPRVVQVAARGVATVVDKVAEEGVELAGADAVRLEAHTVEEVPLKLPSPRPPRPPVGVALSSAAKLHLAAEVASIAGQVVAPDLGLPKPRPVDPGLSNDPGSLPVAVAFVAAVVLARRYNFF